jgi:hypothetical protein
LIDIGGASTELVLIRDSKPEKLASLQMGCLSLYTKFVRSALPAPKERNVMPYARMPYIENAAGIVPVSSKTLGASAGDAPPGISICPMTLQAVVNTSTSSNFENVLIFHLAFPGGDPSASRRFCAAAPVRECLHGIPLDGRSDV